MPTDRETYLPAVEKLKLQREEGAIQREENTLLISHRLINNALCLIEGDFIDLPSPPANIRNIFEEASGVYRNTRGDTIIGKNHGTFGEAIQKLIAFGIISDVPESTEVQKNSVDYYETPKENKERVICHFFFSIPNNEGQIQHKELIVTFNTNNQVIDEARKHIDQLLEDNRTRHSSFTKQYGHILKRKSISIQEAIRKARLA